MTEWNVIDELDNRVNQFVGLGATEQQIRRLLDNWHIVSALASGRLSSCFEEFIPVQYEKDAPDVDWDIWQEKLRHFPVTIDPVTSLRERAVRSGISLDSRDTEIFFVPHQRDRVGKLEQLRLKVIRNRKPVTDLELERFLSAKFLSRARLSHLLEFAGQHPESVENSMFAPGTYLYSENYRGEISLDVPCLRKTSSDRGNRPSGFSMIVHTFKGGRRGVVYGAGSCFLAVRYPLSRDEEGRIIREP